MWSYLKEAFFIRTRTRVFGDLPLNLVACTVFAVVGAVANPGFWFIGMALEVIFLAAVATSPTFHRLVRGRRLLEQQAAEQGQIRTIEEKLSQTRVTRLATIRARGAQVLDTIRRLDDQALDVHVYQHPVQNAIATASKLLLVQEMFAQALANSNETELRRDVSQAQATLNSPTLAKETRESLEDRVKNLTTRLALQQRRADQLTRSENDLMRIENGLEKMLDEVLIAKKPTGLDDFAVDFESYSVDPLPSMNLPASASPNSSHEPKREDA